MEAKITNNLLTITIEMQEPTKSKTGKSLIIASSHGFQNTEAEVNGKTVAVSINAVIKKG